MTNKFSTNSKVYKKALRATTSKSMLNRIRKVEVIASVFSVIELLGLLALILLYYLDFPEGFQNKIKPEYWIIAISAVVAFSIIFLSISLFFITKARRKADLDASTIIGGDIQEAYKFGQLGLVVTDDEDMVLWCSSLFKERGLDILDCNLLALYPSFVTLKEAPAEIPINVNINRRFYSVRYLPDAHLYVFKDVTDYEELLSYSKEQSLVLGIVNIDNFADIAGKTEDENNDLVLNIRNEILTYAKKHKVLLRRFKNDSYFAVTNYASLKSMEDDKFSVLEKVRALGKGMNVIPTLSISFAYDSADILTLNDTAMKTLEYALSRGGDQAAISYLGQETKFYGGKVAAVENNNRVQMRSVATSLITLIKESNYVYVCGHKDMDMDALGSCLGVMALCNYLNKSCKIIYDSRMVENKTKEAFSSSFTRAEIDKMTISPSDAESRVGDSTLCIVCDVSTPNLILGNRVIEKSNKNVVLDHHRRGESFVNSTVFSHIETSASSASEILAEIIHYAPVSPRIEIPPSFATIMLSGMFLDTNFFKSKATGSKTFEAAEILKEHGADNGLADDFLKDDYAEYALVTKIVSTLKTPYTGTCYCVADEHYIIERATLSKVANQIMQIKGVNACFVIGKTSEKEVRISARSDGSVNVQLICEKLGGGGHFAMAAAAFPNVTILSVEEKLIESLDMYLNDARAQK